MPRPPIINVLNVRNHRGFQQLGVNHIYIGRKNTKARLMPSPLRNPYITGVDGYPKECIKLYVTWLKERIKAKDSLVINELQRIISLLQQGYDINLYCWCKPNPCHGDVLKKILLDAFEKTKKQ